MEETLAGIILLKAGRGKWYRIRKNPFVTVKRVFIFYAYRAKLN
jgi:hypothetical protein